MTVSVDRLSACKGTMVLCHMLADTTAELLAMAARFRGRRRMKTAEEWRTWYFLTRGKPVEPASLLGDLLQDLEELEVTNRYLTAALAAQTGVEVED